MTVSKTQYLIGFAKTEAQQNLWFEIFFTFRNTLNLLAVILLSGIRRFLKTQYILLYIVFVLHTYILITIRCHILKVLIERY